MTEIATTTRAMRPQDAEAVRTLMLTCYGDTYFDALYYDADALAKAIASGAQHSAIATLDSGEAVAHLGLRCPPGSRTADSTMAVVDPRFRACGLMVAMGSALVPVYRELDLCGIWLYAVTVHPYTQRASRKGGSGVTGIMLGNIPPGTTFIEIDAASTSNPTAAVVIYQPLQPPEPRMLRVPERYREVVREAVAGSHVERSIEAAEDSAATQETVALRVVEKSRQGIAHIWADTAGADGLERIEAIAGEREASGSRAIYLHLPLDGVATESWVEGLRRRGFFYSGVLHDYAGRDWLTLQRVDDSCLDVENIVLEGEASRRLLQFILADRND